MKDFITHTRLLEILSYDPETGDFRWLETRGNVVAGSVAGSVNENGYRYITIDRRKCTAQRLAWYYVHGEWPEGDVDHRFGVRDKNSFAGSRKSTRTQNMQNVKRHSDNTSGRKGVSWDKSRNLWRATIQINGKWKQIGRFKQSDEAHHAYVAEATKHFGEFARAA